MCCGLVHGKVSSRWAVFATTATALILASLAALIVSTKSFWVWHAMAAAVGCSAGGGYYLLAVFVMDATFCIDDAVWVLSHIQLMGTIGLMLPDVVMTTAEFLFYGHEESLRTLYGVRFGLISSLVFFVPLGQSLRGVVINPMDPTIPPPATSSSLIRDVSLISAGLEVKRAQSQLALWEVADESLRYSVKHLGVKEKVLRVMMGGGFYFMNNVSWYLVVRMVGQDTPLISYVDIVAVIGGGLLGYFGMLRLGIQEHLRVTGVFVAIALTVSSSFLYPIGDSISLRALLQFALIWATNQANVGAFSLSCVAFADVETPAKLISACFTMGRVGGAVGAVLERYLPLTAVFLVGGAIHLLVVLMNLNSLPLAGGLT